MQSKTFTTSATTSYTLDNAVANENELALFINFVRQEPTTAYTASGTTLTLTSATTSSDDMYCVYLGQAKQTVNPPDGSVGSSQVAASIITGQTALGATPADTDELLISDAGTLKRVDFSYLKSGITLHLSKHIYQLIKQFSDNTETKVQFDTEVFDTDGTLTTLQIIDLQSNYEGGKYFVYAQVVTDVTDLTNKLYTSKIAIYKNGSTYKEQDNMPDYSGSSGWDILIQDIFATVVMNG